MPIQQYPKFQTVPDKMLEIANPAMGGINLRDLEFEQEVSQSPYMLNVMYRNGSFGKRYGQEVYASFSDEIYATAYFDNAIFVHSGTKIYRYAGGPTEVADEVPTNKGMFIVFAQKLYYMISSGFYVYNGTEFTTINAYVPEFLINCKPDGTAGADQIDDLNILGTKFKIVYNGESGVTTYKAGEYTKADGVELADWSVRPTIWVEDDETTAFTVNTDTKTITFNTAPPAGSLNVVIEFTMADGLLGNEKAQILNSKFYDTFGGANNSRLFVAGGGNSKYWWSNAYDISYFPENNYATLGNTEEDITGFGRQYNVLIVFKPREIYSIYSYTETASTTVIEEIIGTESFRSQLVNASIGCDAPNSIQLVNNLLTWFNSSVGVCTLTSTNIQDERNVRTISRNVDYTNNFGVKGVLDFREDLNKIQSVDYNNKYFLVFAESGYCFMWDYEITPYVVTSRGETSPRELSWFLFDHFYVKQFLKVGTQLLYAASHENFNTSLIKLNASYLDLDFDGDSLSDPIHAYYQTPFMQFGAVEMLKNVKNLYVQCRGDVSSLINMLYYTDDSAQGEPELDPISTGGKGSLWDNMRWDNFHWFINSWGSTMRRKCSLKKIQMASVYFENNEKKDMAITHIGMQYQLVKYIK